MTTRNNPSCIHQHDAPNVLAESEYSLLGGVMLMAGITAVPKSVRFRCKSCNKVFAESEDPAIRKKYVTS